MRCIENRGNFDDLCQEFESWIIEYKSSNFNCSIYMVWLTDATDNDTDKFILDSNNKIFASTKLHQLLKNISKANLQLPDLSKTENWLRRGIKMTHSPFCSYEIDFIKQGLINQKITHEWLSEVTNLINIYRDYGYQIKDENLIALTNQDELVLVWEFYYDGILWPHLISKSEINKQAIPKFSPNFKKLSDEITHLIQAFEKNISIN